MLIKKKKENHDNQKVKMKKRLLITVNVLGSSGPLRFVVNDDDKVSDVIDSSLKMYARSGRLPVLGSDFNKFLLYPSNAESEAMKANEAVGSCAERTFVMCKKQTHPQMTEARSDMITHHRWSRGWKAWFKKSP
ncbi:hypothetical protein L1987_44323 [Smallanthus sonchifolius]|uniref:Uncharacterized protein n=1 Tax=Smallanthus sonchifolius TaxID=185202 RepID=A0ACB9GP44_9ASTR|nr:hypothetical protein L1987_44323 [Smallanthus sonchifolius]